VQQGPTGDRQHGRLSARDTTATPTCVADDSQQLNDDTRRHDGPRSYEWQCELGSYDDGGWQLARGSGHGEWARCNG
jgi:hypothetical protein